MSEDEPKKRRWVRGLVWSAAGMAIIVASIASVVLYNKARANYLRRAIVSRALDDSQPVIEYFAKTGKLPVSLIEVGVAPTKQMDFHLYDDERKVKITTELSLTPEYLRFAFTGLADGPRTVILKPAANGLWDCTGGDLEASYRPSWCVEGLAPASKFGLRRD